MDLGQRILVAVAALAGNAQDSVYDFKLDQFKLGRHSGEAFDDYESRIFNSPLWQAGFEDFSVCDVFRTVFYFLEV